MNEQTHTTAGPEAASTVPHRPGANMRGDVVYAVSNLGSLFTVCAMALDGVDAWSDEIRGRVTNDVKQVLEWGALLAEDATLLAEKKQGDAR